MNNVTLNIEALQKEYPKSWKDFYEFQQALILNNPFLGEISFASIPFEWQLGVFLHYFEDAGIGLDLCNIDYSNMPQQIIEAFRIQENNISHYS